MAITEIYKKVVEQEQQNPPTREEMEKIKAESWLEIDMLLYPEKYKNYDLKNLVHSLGLIADLKKTIGNGIDNEVATVLYQTYCKNHPPLVPDVSYSSDSSRHEDICQSLVERVLLTIQKNDLDVFNGDEKLQEHIIKTLKNDPKISDWLAKNAQDMTDGHNAKITSTLQYTAKENFSRSNLKEKTLGLIIAHTCCAVTVISGANIFNLDNIDPNLYAATLDHILLV